MTVLYCYYNCHHN